MVICPIRQITPTSTQPAPQPISNLNYCITSGNNQVFQISTRIPTQVTYEKYQPCGASRLPRGAFSVKKTLTKPPSTTGRSSMWGGSTIGQKPPLQVCALRNFGGPGFKNVPSLGLPGYSLLVSAKLNVQEMPDADLDITSEVPANPCCYLYILTSPPFIEKVSV